MKIIKYKKYILTSILFFIFMFIGLNNNIFAQLNEENINENKTEITTINSVFDIKAINGEYKTSNEKSDIYLPFFRNAVGRIEVDKSIDKIGILSSASTIDVNKELRNIQFLLSSDSIRINANMEYGLIWSGKDVVINNNINRNCIVFSGGTVTIEESSDILDDVIIVANSVNIKGNLKGSAIIYSSQIKVSGNIQKDLRCDVSTIEISNNTNVKGNLYVNSYNKDINIKDKYPNAIVNIKEVKNTKKTIGNILIKAIISSFAFSLLYLIVKKVSKGDVYVKFLEHAKNNTLFVILSGSLALLAFPALFVFLLLISAFGLYMITIPVLIVYIAFLIVFWILSVYIVGSTIFEYINKKYIKGEKLSIQFVGIFSTFLSVNLLRKIPFIGNYVYMAIVMISIGIMITYFLKKIKNKE